MAPLTRMKHYFSGVLNARAGSCRILNEIKSSQLSHLWDACQSIDFNPKSSIELIVVDAAKSLTHLSTSIPFSKFGNKPNTYIPSSKGQTKSK